MMFGDSCFQQLFFDFPNPMCCSETTRQDGRLWIAGRALLVILAWTRTLVLSRMTVEF